MRYDVILSKETESRLQSLAKRLSTGETNPGQRVASLITNRNTLNARAVLELLIRSKVPCIFAESEIAGDGSDWSLEELQILGDISIAADVTAFDDGRHENPEIHEVPLPATLVFTPGALLRSDRGRTPADYEKVVVQEHIDPERYYQLYERRLLPVLSYISLTAANRGRHALVTIPGLGCGQFAGRFQGSVGRLLQDTLKRLFATHAGVLERVQAIIYDPYNECADESERFGGIEFRVRPLVTTAQSRPQLCRPTDYQEGNDDFAQCDLYSVVAWDHVSWPGNDFYRGARTTDDGVKAAATNAMEVFTGVTGHYDANHHRYQPPREYRSWEEVVARNELSLEVTNVFVPESRMGED